MIAMAHSGRNAGVTLAEINLAFLADLIRAVQGGKTGYAYVVGPLGRLPRSSWTYVRMACQARRCQVYR